MSRASSIILYAVNIVVSIVEVFLGLRLILKLFGASADAEFVRWMYDNTAELVAPFRGMFETAAIEQQYVLEFSTLFAMIIYGLAGYFLYEIVYEVSQRANRKSTKQ